MLLKQILENKHYIFVEECENWQDSIRKACIPIEKDKTVGENYKEDIIACVEKYGPYIVLIPGVAMPHSQEGAEGVTRTAISFMKVEKPVIFDEEDEDSYANLFFTLAAENPEQHHANIANLMAILTNEDLVAELMQVKNAEELAIIAEKYQA